MLRTIIEFLLRWLRPAELRPIEPIKERPMPSTYNKEELLDQLERHEGYRGRIYFDDLGILTVGIGHAIGSKPVPEGLRSVLRESGIMDTPFSEAAMRQQLLDDLEPAEEEAETLAIARGVNWTALLPRRQMVLVSMCFNMGATRLGGFTLMWAALARGDHEETAVQMLDSKWARQVGDGPGQRADELATMMREG